MYDFYGFEKELYEFEYPIKSDKEITFKILEHLKNNFIDAKIDANRRTYDHGVWSVLSMMYKALSIPVIQLSIPLSYSNQELIKLGESLKVFKDEALIVTSGCLTHNLRDMGFASGIKEYAKKFSQDVVEIIKIGDTQKLLDITSDENFYKNHPTDEHFLPLFIAYGASDDKHGISFNSEITYSNISMESFVFDKSV
jgi:4,5-DOPA dioxygenase extradiol